MFNGSVNSSRSTEMEKYSEIRKGFKLAACESTQAHLELWATAQGEFCEPVTHYTRAQHYAPSTFWSFSISSEISSINKKQWIQGVSVLGSTADTAACNDFLSP